MRAAQDRRVETGSEAEAPAKLWEVLEPAQPLGSLEVEITQRPHRPARQARVTIRSATVTLIPPRRTGYRLPKVTVNAVWVHEDAPPPGVDPLEWLLLTRLPGETFAQAALVVAWYAVRWTMETLFGCLKSRGFNFEDTHLVKAERLSKMLALLALAFAWTYRTGELLYEQTPIHLQKPFSDLSNPSSDRERSRQLAGNMVKSVSTCRIGYEKKVTELAIWNISTS